MKRYLSLFGRLGDPVLFDKSLSFLMDEPEVRDAVFRYFIQLGYSPARYNQIDVFLRDHCTDDVSLFLAAKVLVTWSIPPNSTNRARALELADSLAAARVSSVSATTAGIWIFTKYAKTSRLWRFIRSTATTWLRSAWAARQVAAASPRLTATQRQRLKDEIAAGGLVEALQVLASLESMARLRRLDRQLRMYLLQAPTLPYGYPLEKF